MSRLERAALILDAAEQWKQRCLLDGGSVFTDERLWTREYFRQLHTHFVERPDTGTDSFEEKLRRQLEPASPEAKRLWAEMTWLYLLIATGKGGTKLDRIRTVWESSGTALPDDHRALGDVLDRGIIFPGRAYWGHQWREFNFIITLMLDWTSCSPQDRESLLSDPWVFAEWVDSHREGRQRLFRHAVLFLLFPDVFEPIVSLSHKKAIVKAFHDETGEKPDVDNIELINLDKSLLAVVRRLQDERPGEEILFYHPPLKDRWQDGPSPQNGTDKPSDEKSKDPGRRPNLNFVEMGIPIGSRLVSVKTGKEAIVVSQNRVTFLGGEMSLTAATRRAVGRMQPCPQWTFEGRNLSDIYEKTYGKKPDPEPDPEPYTVATALTDLFVEDSQLQRVLESIDRRKNLILQGPPGVGKTFIAKRIAWCLIGFEDPSSIEMVQFHQSYAYEDFVQGWRPTETGGFTLRNGVFFEFCKRAERDPEMPFVFIIDEINRGNLSRIFGELLMLIEADKRGPDHAISLTYSTVGERFSVPDNVHILGLMNTADRSLAIVDYALRRRFAFETLEPAYGTRQFRDYLLNADVDLSLVDRIDRNLSELNEHIRDDRDLGPGFRIGHSYFVPDDSADEQWYLGIIDTQIAPLLREYWFDRPEQADGEVEKLRR